MIHQLLPSFISADAIGNQASIMRDTLRSMGLVSSQVFAQHRDSRLSDRGKDYRSLRLGPHDQLIYHHSIGSPVVPVAMRHVNRMAFYYHNVTPARFLQTYDQRLANLLKQGRDVLPQFRAAPAVFTDSDYNAEELRSLGFHEPVVIPLAVNSEVLHASANSGRGQVVRQRMLDGEPVNWLFVGRLAPNKRQDALIRAFYYYHSFIEPNSKLYLVGSDMFSPGYRLELEILITSLNLRDHITLAGSPTLQEGFGGYYAGATVFVCASEHEGFCVPITEAMAFGLPVVAYRCTGVPSAVDEGGLLVDDNRPATLAEGVHLLLTDPHLSRLFRERHETHVATHSPMVVANAIRTHVVPLLENAV